MSRIYIVLILSIVKISVGQILNDTSSSEVQECFFLNGDPGESGDSSKLFQFVVHGILLPILALFGLVSNIISIFIFTRREMRTQINFILTGKKHPETRNLSDSTALREEFL